MGRHRKCGNAVGLAHHPRNNPSNHIRQYNQNRAKPIKQGRYLVRLALTQQPSSWGIVWTKAAVDPSRRAWRRPSPYSYGESEGGRPKPAQRHKIDCPYFLLFSNAETDVQPFPGALFVLRTTVHLVPHTILLWFYRIAMSQGVRGQSGSTSRVGRLLCNDVGGEGCA
jgi:hypothetical protein